MVSIIRALVVALKNGEVRIYHNKRMVIKIPPRDPENPDPVLGKQMLPSDAALSLMSLLSLLGAVALSLATSLSSPSS